MASSAQFQIDVGSGYGAAGVAQDAAPSATVTCKLVSVADINPGLITWTIFGTHGVAAPSLTPGGNPTGQTVTFSCAAGNGQAYGIRCEVNGGEDITGRGEDTATSAVYVLDDASRRPFFIGETFEADADYGMVPRLNDMSAAIIGLPGSSTDNAVVRWNGTGGATIQNSGVTISDANLLSTTTLGIGTTTVPHGGVGVAKLAIEGTDASLSDGPNLQITTSFDNYPLIQVIAYQHDAMNIFFDAFQDSAGASKSSDPGSNFAIGKGGDLLLMRYDSGIAAGSNLIWNTGLSLDTAGIVGIPAKLGIGTTAVPHGGVGVAKLAIEGADSSNSGPHVAFTTAVDDRPLIQILAFKHTAQEIAFDAYYDGAWKSSDANASYTISKRTNHNLELRYDNVAVDGAITWNTGLSLDTAGLVTIPGTLEVGASIQTYTPSNVTTDRTYDANSTTLDEIADVLGTLIGDLQTIGLIN